MAELFPLASGRGSFWSFALEQEASSSQFGLFNDFAGEEVKTRSHIIHYVRNIPLKQGFSFLATTYSMTQWITTFSGSII